jgi:hypothetical protein
VVLVKVPLRHEIDAPRTERFTLPHLSSYGAASILTMTPEQIESAKQKEERGKPFGFNKGK